MPRAPRAGRFAIPPPYIFTRAAGYARQALAPATLAAYAADWAAFAAWCREKGVTALGQDLQKLLPATRRAPH